MPSKVDSKDIPGELRERVLELQKKYDNGGMKEKVFLEQKSKLLFDYLPEDVQTSLQALEEDLNDECLTEKGYCKKALKLLANYPGEVAGSKTGNLSDSGVSSASQLDDENGRQSPESDNKKDSNGSGKIENGSCQSPQPGTSSQSESTEAGTSSQSESTEPEDQIDNKAIQSESSKMDTDDADGKDIQSESSKMDVDQTNREDIQSEPSKMDIDQPDGTDIQSGSSKADIDQELSKDNQSSSIETDNDQPDGKTNQLEVRGGSSQPKGPQLKSSKEKKKKETHDENGKADSDETSPPAKKNKSKKLKPDSKQPSIALMFATMPKKKKVPTATLR